MALKACLLLLSIFAFASKAGTLEVVFEHNPPFQMINERGHGYGPVYEFAQKLLLEAKVSGRFFGKPWARIIKKDATTANKLILSISKTPSRTEHFIWLTDIYKSQQYIWKVVGKAEPEGKPLLVSVERDSHKLPSLQSYFHQDHIVELPDTEQALNALLKGRVDRYVGMPFAIESKLKNLGYDMSVLQRLNRFDEAQFASQGLYLAITLGTDESIKVALQQALKQPNIVKARAKLIAEFNLAEQALLLP